MTAAVLGAGAFGTALALSLAKAGPVTLYVRDPDRAGLMTKTRENRDRLPGHKIGQNVTITSDLSAASEGDVLLLAVPMQSLRGFAQTLSVRENQALIACCKGIEQGSGLGPVAVLSAFARDPALLSGPSFADEIARGLPTALTLACQNETRAVHLQGRLTTPNLRLYRTRDVIGAEIGGALKNVIAIACGAAIGAGLGESARAALMTRGFAEMQRVASLRGAQTATLMGLSGFGDLALTCASPLSRNFRLGQALGRGDAFDPEVTVEGVATAAALHETARDLPITKAVVDLVSGKCSVKEIMSDLLSRPLRAE
jgi:glycerol-3-phosphate dehydrogenase (NAD(P)+)